MVHNDGGLTPLLRKRSKSMDVLPEEALIYLIGSRYCDTERLSNTAWSLFGHCPKVGSWSKPSATTCMSHVTFGYEHARAFKRLRKAIASEAAYAVTSRIWR